MSHIVILAGSVQEAAKYTRKANLPRGRYICPMSASQIDGVVPSEVHTLPGFRKRRDTHAILATVKRSSKRYQNVRFFDIDERGPLTDRQLVVAHRYNALVDAGIPENVDPVIAMASVEVTPEDIVAEGATGTPEDVGAIDMDALATRQEEMNAQIAAKGIELKPIKPRRRPARKPALAPQGEGLPEIFE